MSDCETVLCSQVLGIPESSSINANNLHSDQISQEQSYLINLENENLRLKAQLSLYSSAFDTAVNGIMVISSDNRIVNVNQAVEYMLGYQAEELREMSICDLILPEDSCLDTDLVQDLIDGRRNYYQIEKRFARNDGMLFWGMVTVSVVRDIHSDDITFIHTIEDISARKSTELQTRQASIQDSMTGLFNRAYFDSEFGRLQYSMRLPVSIIVIDVDGLKQMNDTKGHEAGDKLLISVANILKESFRGDDTVARTGGDEFSVLLPETGEDALKIVIERVRKCQERFNAGSLGFKVNFSIGSATALKGDDIPKAMKLADERMYSDKAANKAERLLKDAGQ